MKTTKKLAIGISFAALVGFIVYWTRSSKKNRRMLEHHIREQVAEEGYETAQDILFPNKGKKARKHGLGQSYAS